MGASIWAPDGSINADSRVAAQRFVATAGQETFNLTAFTYAPNTYSLLVFVDGIFQAPYSDTTEPNQSSFTIPGGVPEGSIVMAIGAVAVESVVAVDPTAARSGANSDITSLSALSTPLSRGQGGTGVAATTAANLLTQLGAVQNTGAENVDGVKTFIQKPILPAATPTGNEAVSAAYLAAQLLTVFVGGGVKQGLAISNNGADATNDIDIAAGKAVDVNGVVSMSLGSAMTKRLDANWAAGTNQGGRYSGAAIANTTYHVWLVAKAAGADVDVYLHPSAVAATVLANLQAEGGGASYIYLWRIGSILRESAAIVGFVQTGSEFLRKASILDVNITNSTTAAVTTTVSVPVGTKVLGIFNAYVLGGGGGELGSVYLSSLDVNDEAPSDSAAPLSSVRMSSIGGVGVGQVRVRTNTSAQIRRRTGSASVALTRVATLGWVDDSIYRAY